MESGNVYEQKCSGLVSPKIIRHPHLPHVPHFSHLSHLPQNSHHHHPHHTRHHHHHHDHCHHPLQDGDPLIVNLNKFSRILFELQRHDDLSKKGICCR